MFLFSQRYSNEVAVFIKPEPPNRFCGIIIQSPAILKDTLSDASELLSLQVIDHAPHGSGKFFVNATCLLKPLRPYVHSMCVWKSLTLMMKE